MCSQMRRRSDAPAHQQVKHCALIIVLCAMCHFGCGRILNNWNLNRVLVGTHVKRAPVMGRLCDWPAGERRRVVSRSGGPQGRGGQEGRGGVRRRGGPRGRERRWEVTGGEGGKKGREVGPTWGRAGETRLSQGVMFDYCQFVLGQLEYGQFWAVGISHDNPRTPTVHISGPNLQNTTKIPRTPQEREIRVVGEGKKREI